MPLLALPLHLLVSVFLGTVLPHDLTCAPAELELAPNTRRSVSRGLVRGIARATSLSRVASHVHVLMCALEADRGSCEQMRAIALLGSPWNVHTNFWLCFLVCTQALLSLASYGLPAASRTACFAVIATSQRHFRERGKLPWPRHCHDRGQPRRARWQSTSPMTDLVLYVLQTLSMFRNSMPRDPDSIMLQSTPHSHLPCAGSGILPVSKWLYYQHPGTPSISRDMTRYISNVLRPALSMATAAAPSNGQA